MTRGRPMKNSQRRPRSRPMDDERLEIARTAMYFAPKYCKSGGEWALKSLAKLVEVKRLMGSERSAKALYNLSCKWFETNEAKWDEMKAEALADWEGYFAEEIARENELDKEEGDTEGGSNDHGRVNIKPVVTKIEQHSSDGSSGQRPGGATGAPSTTEGRGVNIPGAASDVPQVHHHGPVYHFTAPVNINLKVDPGDIEMLIARLCPTGSAQL